MRTKWGDEVPAIEIVIEECAEVIQAIQKIKRFGIDDVHPITQIPNDVSLLAEVEQLQEALHYMRMELAL